MPDTTPLLALPYLLAAQAQKHVTHNAALQALDALVQLSVLDQTRTAPPSAPGEGDRHLVAAGATGLWAGWDGDIAYRIDGAWLRLIPRPGWLLWVVDDALMLLRDASAWVDLAAVLGVTGATGSDGASAYEIWIAAGNSGTESEFLASLIGADGADGLDGIDGTDGASAYQVWLDAGNAGSEGDFLAALVGEPGPKGPAGSQGPAGVEGPAGPAGADGADGLDGADGTSVTILGALASTGDLPAVGNTQGDGYVIAGNLHVWDGSAWIDVGPIQGPQGEPGPAGSDGADGVDGLDGADGASAYMIWLAAGNTGTEAEFLAALVGPAGPTGPEGPQGVPGVDGANGLDGAEGVNGSDGANGVNGIDGADGVDGANGIGFLWRGAWAEAEVYAAQDVVSHGGSSWLCTAAHTAGPTTEPGTGASWASVWDLAAAKGATGDLTAQGMIGTGPALLARRPITTQSGSYVLALGDEGASVHMTNATAATVTVPAEASVGFAIGAEIEVVALGAGVVTIAGDTGVTLNGIAAGSAEIAGAFQGAVLRKYAADTWLLLGAIGELA